MEFVLAAPFGFVALKQDHPAALIAGREVGPSLVKFYRADDIS